MPAYTKVSLVTPVFHPSDIAFVRHWSALAPGRGGWRVTLDSDAKPELVSVTPPGAEAPLYMITKAPREVILHERRPGQGGEMAELERFEGLRDAVLALCALGGDALEQIHVTLERDFPRRDR